MGAKRTSPRSGVPAGRAAGVVQADVAATASTSAASLRLTA
jgi:hypothetical protein